MIIRLSMSQRYKIGASFAVFAIIFLGLSSIYQIHLLNQDNEDLLKSEMKAIAALNDLLRLQERLQHLRVPEGYMLRPDLNEELQEQLGSISSLTTAVGLIGTESTPVVTHVLALTASLTTGLQDTIPPFLRRASDLTASAAPIAFFPRPGVPLQQTINELATALHNFQKSSKAHITQFQGQAHALGQGTQARIGLLTLLTVFIAISLAAFFAQQISLPVQRVVDLINRIRDGQYVNLNIREQTEDEIGRIFNSLLYMVNHIATRDQLKLEKIDLEKRRFEVLGNQIKAPFLLLNRDRQVAFANHSCLELFRLAWDDVYELELAKIAIPPQLKDEINGAIAGQRWNEDKKLDLIGENYLFDLTLRVVPVTNHNSETHSIICLLGKLKD